MDAKGLILSLVLSQEIEKQQEMEKFLWEISNAFIVCLKRKDKKVEVRFELRENSVQNAVEYLRNGGWLGYGTITIIEEKTLLFSSDCQALLSEVETEKKEWGRILGIDRFGKSLPKKA